MSVLLLGSNDTNEVGKTEPTECWLSRGSRRRAVFNMLRSDRLRKARSGQSSICHNLSLLFLAALGSVTERRRSTSAVVAWKLRTLKFVRLLWREGTAAKTLPFEKFINESVIAM